MARRPKLPKVDAEMQRWCAQLEGEVLAWPHVSSRPMFGLLGLYRRKKIFAALPRTRAVETPFSLLVKLPRRRHDRLRSGSGPGAAWVTFTMDSEVDISEALHWLGQAYEQAGKPPR
jgi:hypothetical protein